MNNQDALYPIREVSRLTGVNSITLRAWERRYNLFEPIRTESGHRLFTQAHVDRIQAAVKLTQQGIPISQVKRFLDEEVSEPQASTEMSGQVEYEAEILSALEANNRSRLQSLLDGFYADWPESFVSQVLRKITLAVEENALSQQVLWSSALLPRLYLRLRNQSGLITGSRHIWVQSASSQVNEIHVVLVALAMSAQGWTPFISNTHADSTDSVEEVFSSMKTLGCSRLVVVDDSAEFDSANWEASLATYASVDVMFVLNQVELPSLDQLMSVSQKGLLERF